MSENLGWRVVMWGHNLSLTPLVEIGLTDLPKSGGKEGGGVPLSLRDKMGFSLPTSSINSTLIFSMPAFY